MVRPSMRGGVPVLRRPTGSFEFAQPRAEALRRRIAGAAGLVVAASPTWICPDRNVPAVSTTASASNSQPDLRDDARDPVAVEQQVVDRLLEQREVRLVLEAAADRAPCRARGRPARASRAPPGPCSR